MRATKLAAAVGHVTFLRLLPAFVRRSVESRPGLVRILDNIGWLFVDRVLRLVVGLAIGVWLARYLGPEQLGQLSYAIAFVGLFGAIASLGLNGIVVRDIVRDPDGARSTLGTAFVLSFLGGLIASALAFACITWLRPHDGLTRMFVVILAFGFLIKSTEVIKYWFDSQLMSRYPVWIEGGAFLSAGAVKIAMIVQEAPLIAFVWITLAEAALGAAGLVAIYVKRAVKVGPWRVRARRAKRLVKDSLPLALSGLAVMVYMRIDQIMLGDMLGAEAVGIYSASVRISEMCYFIPMAIATSLLPSTIEAKKNDETLYYRRLQKLFNLTVLTALAIALPTALFSSWIVQALYGEKFAPAGTILAIHAWGGVFVSLGVISSNWLLVENLQKLSFYRTLFGAAINVGLNCVLIPTYGIEGAAVATVLSYAAAALLFDLLNRKSRVLFIMKLRSLSFGAL